MNKRKRKRERVFVLVAAMMLLMNMAGCGGCNRNSEVQKEKIPIAESVITTGPEFNESYGTVTSAGTPAAPEPTEVPTPTAIPPEPTEVPTPTVIPPEPTEVPTPTAIPPEPTEVPTPTAIPPEPTEVPTPTAIPPEPTEAPTPTVVPTEPPRPTTTPEDTVIPGDVSDPKPTEAPRPTGEAYYGITAGDYVTFGSYEQDGDRENGKEPIEWLVLEVRNGSAFLLSKYVLDAQPYDSRYNAEEEWAAILAGEEYDYHATWEKSEIRTWLNETFYYTAFTTEEKEGILLSEVENLPNSLRGQDSGPDTMDKVYLLSESEALRYFDKELMLGREPRNVPEDRRHLGVPTAYASEQGLNIVPGAAYWPKNYTTWSLRTIGGFGSHNVYLNRGGFLQQDGAYDVNIFCN